MTTWQPGGASEASWTVGKQSSVCGFDGRLAVARARLMAVEHVERLRHLDETAVVGPRLARARAGQLRQLAHGEVDLHRRALAAIGADGSEELRGQIAVAEEREERALGIGVREHRARAQLAAVGEQDAHRGAALDEHALDRDVGADLGSRLARGVGHQPGDRAHAAAARSPRPTRPR